MKEALKGTKGGSKLPSKVRGVLGLSKDEKTGQW